MIRVDKENVGYYGHLTGPCCCYSAAQSCLTLRDTMDCSMPGLPCLQKLPKFTSTALLMPSSHLILWCPLLLLPSIFPSIRDFVCNIWPKYWSFSFTISPSSDYSGLISLKIDWFDLLAVEETLKSLLQHHNSKASVLQCSAFLMVQLSYLYMTTGKTIALTRWTYVGKVISLPFNMLSRLVIVLFQGARVF